MVSPAPKPNPDKGEVSVYVRVRLVWLFLSLCAAISAIAQNGNNFRQVNLVSNVPGLALKVDPDLASPWGIALSAGQPFRIVSNSNGKFKSYDATGAQLDSRAVVAPPSGDMTSAMPSGVAANPTSLFVPRTSLSTPSLCLPERDHFDRVRGWAVSMIALAAATFGSVATIGCGSYSRRMRPARGTASIVVTATAGSVSHTSTLALTLQ